MKPLVIWLVGGSSGIGLELVRLWLEQGHFVIASSRNASSAQALIELQARHKTNLHLLNLDITCKEAITSSVHEAWGLHGRIDRWMYNAGAYEVMKMEEWTEENFEKMAQTNYLGAVRLMIPLSPLFAKQGYGEWIWNVSLASYFGLPYGGAYSAPKAALTNLAESIAPELLAKNIHLRIINHGFVKTRLTQKNTFTMPQLMTPLYAAQCIVKEVDKSDTFEIRFPYGLSFALRFLRSLPYRLSLWLTRKAL